MTNKSDKVDFCEKVLDRWSRRSTREMTRIHGRPELVEKMKNEVKELLQKWGC